MILTKIHFCSHYYARGMQAFYDFLQEHRVDKNCDFTHTSLGYPKGSYYVPTYSADRFLELYCAAVEHTNLYVTEKHKDVGPVCIDIDLRFNNTSDTSDIPRRYNEGHLQKIVSTYSDCIHDLFDIPGPITAVIMEKPKPTLHNNLIKDGIHIIFPDVVTQPSEQFIIRAEVLERLPKILDLQPCNNWTDVIDESVIQKNNWMMYGSRKPAADAYVITHVWKITQNTPEFERCPFDARNFTHWVSQLSIRNKTRVAVTTESRRMEVYDMDQKLESRQRPAIIHASAVSSPVVSSLDDFEIAKRLVAILSAERASSYESWMKVGWCLHNIDNRLLPDWDEFSKKSDKYVKGECAHMWATKMRKDSLGMGSLMMWARQDDPARFQEIVQDRVRNLILKSCSSDSITHHDVAKVIHAMFRHRYACANIRNRKWYEFGNHRWRVCDSAYTLRMHISNEVYHEYLQTAMFFQQRASAESARSHDDQSQHTVEKVKRINNIALKLKAVPFKEALMKELADMFYHVDFESKLDTQPHLVCFENGVYDLDRNEFRRGDPDDFVSFTTGYNYVPYDPYDPIVSEINLFFEQVFRIPAVRKYVIGTLASSLHGGIKYERYTIWHGEQGANGKSKLLDLIETTFGDYAVKFPVTLLTQKRPASNAANSELARSKGRRFASMQEPGENEVLNIGLMKELSGNDRIVARHLFCEAIEFRPFFKMFMCCNQLPAVHSQDGGTWRRISVIRFNSRFCERPDPNNPNEFQVDYELSNKFDKWKPFVMGMLLEMVPKVRNGIREPPEVLEYTMRYQKENDSVAEFYDSCVREAPADADPIPMLTQNALWSAYANWRKREKIQRNIKKSEFRSMIEKRMGSRPSADADGWEGYVLVATDFDGV